MGVPPREARLAYAPGGVEETVHGLELDQVAGEPRSGLLRDGALLPRRAHPSLLESGTCPPWAWACGMTVFTSDMAIIGRNRMKSRKRVKKSTKLLPRVRSSTHVGV